MSSRTHAREAKREREEQREWQEDQRRLQQAFNQNGDLSKGFIEDILDTDDISVGDSDDLQEVTVAKIQSMLSRQWILSNLTDAQEHDIRYKLEVMKLKIQGAHPPEDGVTGKARAFLLDDEMEELNPLTQQERILIDELFETLKALVTRGRGGFERKQMNTSIARSESEKQEQKEDGMLRGLF